MSDPIAPSGSPPFSPIGASRMRNSSSVYPKVRWRRCTEAGVYTMCSRSGRSARRILPCSMYSPHGLLDASSVLISSSSMMRPATVSTRNIFPGRRRPRRATRPGAMSSTPVSDASTIRPSVVTSHRPGRRPLRSSVAPTSAPSLNTIAAGPSHGSMRPEWYS